MERWLQRYWFMLGLLATALLTWGEPSGGLATVGRWLAARQVPELVIFMIFFLSGVTLRWGQVRRGVTDWVPVLLALTICTAVAPLIGFALSRLPFAGEMRSGLLLLAAVPTTLSTGLVMATAAGGNSATALTVTLLSNGCAALSVPWLLSLLLNGSSSLSPASLDRTEMALRIGLLVVLPLSLGILANLRLRHWLHRLPFRLGNLNQILVLAMVWIALSGSRTELRQAPALLVQATFMAIFFHVLVWLAIALVLRLVRLPPGRREAVIFLGGQKTLTLCVLLHGNLFPGNAAVLLFCVVHHIAHLVMDGYLVGRLNRAERR